MRKFVEKMIRYFMHCLLEANGRGVLKEDHLDYEEYCAISELYRHPDIAYELVESKWKVFGITILMIIAITELKALIFLAKRKDKKARGN